MSISRHFCINLLTVLGFVLISVAKSVTWGTCTWRTCALPPIPERRRLVAARERWRWCQINWGSKPWSQLATISIYIYTDCWFQTCFIFHNIWDNPSHWLIFFRGVETTNQYNIYIYTYNYVHIPDSMCICVYIYSYQLCNAILYESVM